MQLYKLLIDGLDFDTGHYEYFPYAEAFIKNPEAVSLSLKKLKISDRDNSIEENVYAKYCVGDEGLNEIAISSAFRATMEFQKVSMAKRFKMLSDVRKRFADYESELLKLLIIEGHPVKLAEWEIFGMKQGISSDTLDFYKSQLRQSIGMCGDEKIYWARKPDGVVCLEPPRNAPSSNSFTAVLAFLPGNSLIVKPPLRNPISTIFLWRNIIYPALIDNGAPKGILNLIIGNSKNLLDQWLNSCKVSDVIYFGDSDRGLRIGSEIFQKGKKPILELSGNDILIVWKDGNLEAAAESLLDSFLGSAQICMVPKCALIHEEVFDDFLALMMAKVGSIKAGLPNDPTTHLSPVGRLAEFKDFFDDAIKNGGRIIFGGRRLNYLHEDDPKGIFIEPTLIAVDDVDKAAKMKCVNEETFFPLLPIVSVKARDIHKNILTDDESIFESILEIVQNNQYGLRLSVWIKSPRFLRKFVKFANNSGLLRVNSRHVGFSPLLGTHGGPRRSGGPFGEMNYIWQKTSHLQGISIFTDRDKFSEKNRS